MSHSFSHTVKQYETIVDLCRDLYLKKLDDYGASWSIMRPSSITDQMFIKLKRIRTIECTGEALVEDGIFSELIALVNYGIMGVVLIHKSHDKLDDLLSIEESKDAYNAVAKEAEQLMKRKNHDYGEAWREMRLSSLTDLMLTKIYRIKELEDHQGQAKVSEGIDANYFDIVNYAIFALIRIHLEGEDKSPEEKPRSL